MIFAFMELISESEDGHPAQWHVDYTMPTTTLYFKTMHALLSGPDSQFGRISGIDGIRNALRLEPAEVEKAITSCVDPGRLVNIWVVTGRVPEGMIHPYRIPDRPDRELNF